MYVVAIVLSVLLLVLAAMQAVLTLGFLPVLWRFRRPLPADDQCPAALVVLCLRGADPFLSRCLRALLALDYPRYDVKVVVDHPRDPGWQVVEQIVEQCGTRKVHMEPLEERLHTCSLKCSSLLQALRNLDGQYEVVALIDADIVPQRSWLRELVAPLVDGRVAVAAGNRWYMPSKHSWGALVRYVWNVSAVVQMYWSRFTWGGSLVIRSEVLRKTDLLKRWSKAFCEDTMLYDVVRSHGYRIAFVPSVLMVNRESCDLRSFFRWMLRQLLNGQLYHPSWLLVATLGIFNTVVLAVALLLVAAAAITGQADTTLLLGVALLLYQGFMAVLVLLLESSARRVVRGQGESTRWLSPGGLLKLLMAVPATQALYGAALVSLAFVRTFEWRGVSYRVDDAWSVRLLEYRPFQRSEATGDASL